MTDTERQGYVEDFEKLTARAAATDGAWVADLRSRAMERFRSLGFPSTREEEWKYTNLDPLREACLRTADPPAPDGTPDPDPPGLRGWERYELTFPRAGDGAGPPLACGGGVFVGRLADAIQRRPSWLESHLGRHADYANHPFRALNTAFMEDGGAVRLGPGKTLDKAVELTFTAVPGRSRNRILHPRTLVVVGPHSRLTLVETYAGSGDEVYCTNAVTEVVLEEDAALDHYRVQREGRAAFHLATVHVRQARNSRYRSCSVSSGGALARIEINALLDGEGADCELHGLYVAGRRQHVDNRTAIEHAKPHGTSRELYKGLLHDRARAVFNGKILVREEAQKTDARQSNRNLMLSRDAEIDSKPQLEILADDVRCSHGATIAQLEEDELFYLRSRGLDRTRARELLVRGFAGEVLDGIAIEPLREGLAAEVLSDLRV